MIYKALSNVKDILATGFQSFQKNTVKKFSQQRKITLDNEQHIMAKQAEIFKLKYPLECSNAHGYHMSALTLKHDLFFKFLFGRWRGFPENGGFVWVFHLAADIPTSYKKFTLKSLDITFTC
jgi:hypothetical protein